MANKVHLILQAKGGVGKSYVASLLAQHYLAREIPCTCIDADPSNATLAGYAALHVRRADILEPGSTSRIAPTAFDALVNEIAEASTDFIVDSGASAFLALSDYLLETRDVEALVELGKEVYLHSVITGAQALRDTLKGFETLVTQAPPAARVVVWLNGYFGPIELDGKSFTEMRVFERNRDRVRWLLELPRWNRQTFGRDIEHLISRKLTFAEALAGKPARVSECA